MMPPTLNVHWDESKLNTLQPNLCCVTNTAEGVTMLLAQRPGGNAASGPITITEGDRLLLTPVTAKLLAELLGNAVRKHEQQHGPIQSLLQPRTGVGDEPLASTAEMAEKATTLLDLINGLGVRCTYERSFKIYRRTLLPHRFLVWFRRESASPQALVALPGVCERLGMPAQFMAEFQQNLPRASDVYFGFEQGEHSSIYKAYVQFTDPQDAPKAGPPPLPVPVLLYVAYKWDVFDSRKATRANYTGFPGLSRDAMRARLERIFEGPDSRPRCELANLFIMTALTRAPHSVMRYLEVAEEGNPRKSFDFNGYDARLRVAEFYPLLVQLCLRYEVGPGEFLPIYDRIKMKEFGHLSGGVDREGRDFLTVYFGESGGAA